MKGHLYSRPKRSGRSLLFRLGIRSQKDNCLPGVFAILVILIGSIWGIGKAAVYKQIPQYYPEEVGVVGGMVGVLGGLGGFFGPIIFGYLLEGTGLWTSSWMFMFLLSALCLAWMYRVIEKKRKREKEELMKKVKNL